MSPHHELEEYTPPRSKPAFGRWILLSIVLHALLLAFFALHEPDLADLAAQEKARVRWVELVDRGQFERRQIVDIPNLAPEEKPRLEDRRYLSTKNQRVDEETQAPREKPDRWRAALQGRERKSPQARLDSEGAGLKPVPKPKGLDMAPGDEAPQEAASDSDYLKGVRFGEHTYINAEEFKHTGYYLEIKRKIEITWNPNTALRAQFSRGISIERGVLSTYLGITLRPDGQLDDVALLQSSGVDALDQEAVRSFRASAPFTKVPEDLLAPDRKLRFEFGFIIYGH